jgi:hypothetical protein
VTIAREPKVTAGLLAISVEFRPVLAALFLESLAIFGDPFERPRREIRKGDVVREARIRLRIPASRAESVSGFQRRAPSPSWVDPCSHSVKNSASI